MLFQISPEISRFFKGLAVGAASLQGVKVSRYSVALDEFVAEAVEYVRKAYVVEELAKNPLARAYRDFFWKISIDPTKTRPSAEALLRRVLQGKDFPRVNSLVDICNVVSMKRLIPVAAYDREKISGNLCLRFSRDGELFYGIGMDKPLNLTGREVVIEDGDNIVSVYPHRDSEISKVTENTRNVVLMVWGVPGVENKYLEDALDEVVAKVQNFCGGAPVSKQLYQT
ncbi:MAG: phenylalanine--tRNA ligase beta subunit-related protein [Candidatus Caldarchaeum sp.]